MHDKCFSSGGKSVRVLTPLLVYAAVSTVMTDALIAAIDGTSWSVDAVVHWCSDSVVVSAKYVSVPIASLALSFLVPHEDLGGPSLLLLACRALMAPMVQIAAFLCIAVTNGLIHGLALSDVARVYWRMVFSRFGSLFAGNLIGPSLWRSKGAAGKWSDRNVRLHLKACTGLLVSLVFTCLSENCSMSEAIRQSVGAPHDFVRNQVKASVVDDLVTQFVDTLNTAKR
jgi:hypothetical protein